MNGHRHTVHKHITKILNSLSIINPGIPAPNMCNPLRIILGENDAVALTGVPALASIKNRLCGSCSHFVGWRAAKYCCCWPCASCPTHMCPSEASYYLDSFKVVIFWSKGLLSVHNRSTAVSCFAFRQIYMFAFQLVIVWILITEQHQFTSTRC